jgi:prophage regulatory protein
MTYRIQQSELINEVRTQMSRRQYTRMWQRMRDSDAYDMHPPSLCTINKQSPAVVGGSATPYSPSKLQPKSKKLPSAKSSKGQDKSKSNGTSNTTSCSCSSSDDDDPGSDEPDRPLTSSTDSIAQNYSTGQLAIHPISNAALLRLPQVLALVPVSKSTWWNGVKHGRYPAPVKPSRRITAWRYTDILTLLASLSDDSVFAPGEEATQ